MSRLPSLTLSIPPFHTPFPHHRIYHDYAPVRPHTATRKFYQPKIFLHEGEVNHEITAFATETSLPLYILK